MSAVSLKPCEALDIFTKPWLFILLLWVGMGGFCLYFSACVTVQSLLPLLIPV